MYQLKDSCQKGTILHCFNWDYKDIKASVRAIAGAGFSSVQLPPVQPTPYNTEKHFPWHIVYQPVGLSVKTANNEPQILRELCTEAHKYGLKVIVDVVSNHLIYIDGVSPEDYKKPDHWHDEGLITDYTSRENITKGNLCGLRDLNTENKEVQQHVRDYLDELYESGVDGIRWDAAKHIGLPSEGSDYWPSVIDNRFYNYGEILEGPVDSDEQYELMKEYASLMCVTDSLYGTWLVEAFKNSEAPDFESKWLENGINADRLVFWGESHDTYSNGPDEKEATTRLSQNIIDRAYAVAASREGATALYLSRPYEIERKKILYGTKGSMHFTSPEVKAINHFHNAMEGRKDCVITENNCVVITRQNGGAVIVCGAESGEVSVKNAGGYAPSGEFYDEISGNIFTVTEESITGTVGESGIAVIYDSGFLGELTADSNETTEFYGNLEIKLGSQNMKNTYYELVMTEESGKTMTKNGTYCDGDVLKIGAGCTGSADFTLTLTGRAINGKPRKEIYEYRRIASSRDYPFTSEQRNKDGIVTFDNSTFGWKDVYLYAYSRDGGEFIENAAYPGKKMSAGEDDFYFLALSDSFIGKGVYIIFNNGLGAQISEAKNSVLYTEYPCGPVFSKGYWKDFKGSSDRAATGHNHFISYIAKKKPTESFPGFRPFYGCLVCKKAFTDLSGISEIDLSTLLIPPLSSKQ